MSKENVEKYKKQVGLGVDAPKKKWSDMSKKEKVGVAIKATFINILIFFVLLFLFFLFFPPSSYLFKGHIIPPALVCKNTKDMVEAQNARGQNNLALVLSGKCYVETKKAKGVFTPAIDTDTWRKTMYLFQSGTQTGAYVSKTQARLTELWSDPHDPEKAKLIMKCKNNQECISKRNDLK